MDNVLAPVRDLTDSDQNQAVLDVASVLIEGGLAAERVADGYGPAVMAEAAAVARSRRRLAQLAGPIHLTVVWAMYGETGRMVPRAEHPHGEDFVRTKVRQLDWLTGGLPGVTWSIIACDDGCSDQPSSADLMTEIAAAEGYPKEGNRSVTVLRLAEVIANGPSISPAFDRLTSTDQSRKGGSILAGLAAAVGSGPAQATGAGLHVVSYTDADLSANLAQLGSLAAPIVGGDKVVAALGQRYGIDGAVLIRADGPSTEPHSTGDKPDKVIILFRHFVRALLVPSLAHVLDTQAGFKAFDGPALRPVIGEMTSFNETFDVELLIHLAQRYGPAGAGGRADRLHRGLRRDELPFRRPRAAPPGHGSAGRRALRPARRTGRPRHGRGGRPAGPAQDAGRRRLRDVDRAPSRRGRRRRDAVRPPVDGAAPSRHPWPLTIPRFVRPSADRR